jgi:hypothetical protein
MRSSRGRIGLGVLLGVVAGAWYLQRRQGSGPASAVTVPWPPLPPDPERSDPPNESPAEETTSPGGGATTGEVVAWIAPCDGTCPDSHPVKVKLRSGLFHLPGMSLYGRTKADRCYGSAGQATADGFQPSSR